VSRSGLSLVASVNLLTKIYFPRLLIPTASVGAALVDFVLSFIVYVAIMLWYMHFPGLSVLYLPLLVLATVMTALGTGYVLTSLAVVYRDFRIIIPFMVQVWMYASPVVYPVTLLPEQYRWVMALNPMSGIIGGYRSALLNQPMDWQALAISTAVAAVIFVFGLFSFRRAERRFADIA
jgi:lipopolysaccharide transport system permease protein